MATQPRRNLVRRMLREVNAAISALLEGAQSATITAAGGTETYSRPRLPELMALRDKLMLEYQAMSHRRKRVYADFS